MGRRPRKIFSAVFEKWLEQRAARHRRSSHRPEKFQLIQIKTEKNLLKKLVQILEHELYPCLERSSVLLSQTIITSLRENYAERLPKTFRYKTAYFMRSNSKASIAAERLGISQLLKSEALLKYAELISGQTLESNPGTQIICYEHGDFSGPHTDHHPEQPELKNGYVDVHIMLSSDDVQSQYLVYEREQGLLNEAVGIAKGAAIAVYHLPFWHYTTPLQKKKGRDNAKRWLLLASYTIAAARP